MKRPPEFTHPAVRRLRIKQSIRHGHGTDIIFSRKIDACSGKAVMAAAMRVCRSRFEAQPPVLTAGLGFLRVDQQLVLCIHIQLAQLFIGAGRGKDARMSADVMKLVMAISVVDRSDHCRAMSPPTLKADAPVSAHALFDSVIIAGWNDLRRIGYSRQIQHFVFDTQRRGQIHLQALLERHATLPLNEPAKQDEVDIRIDSASCRQLVPERGLQCCPEILPLPGVKRIPGRQRGCMRQQPAYRDPAESFFQPGQLSDFVIQADHVFRDQLQYLGRSRDFGQ